MPTGTKPPPTAITFAIASQIRGAMASSTPVIPRADVVEATGISRAMVHRFLKPERIMDVEQLVAVCDAVGLDAGDVMAAALAEVRSRETGVPAHEG